MDCTDLREVNSFSFDLNFFHVFAWTRTYMPLPFLPNATPRNLKFRIANTLTVRLFSRLTVNFSFPSRYFVLFLKSHTYKRHSNCPLSELCRVGCPSKNPCWCWCQWPWSSNHRRTLLLPFPTPQVVFYMKLSVLISMSGFHLGIAPPIVPPLSPRLKPQGIVLWGLLILTINLFWP